MWSNILDRISFLALFFVIVLLPVFFLPFTKVSVETSKGLLLVVGLAVSIIFWALARFSDGKVVIPRSLPLLSGLGIVVVTLLSAIFSTTPKVAFFGGMLDLGTFWFIFASFLLMLYSAIVLGNRKNARIVLLGVLASSAFVLFFQVLRFFAPSGLSFGVLGGKLGNLVGAWNALGVFAGLSVLVCLFIVEFFSISKMGKWILGFLMTLSVFIVAAVSFPFVWTVLGIFALIIFVYKISFSPATEQTEEVKKVHFPMFSFAIVMVSLLFFTSGQYIGRYIPNQLELSSNEVGPSFSSTMSITKEVLKTKPILGTGPNTFGQGWALYRSPQINNTLFWNVPFNVGSGLVPTLVSTTGYLGILAWLVFFIVFLMAGVKSVFANLKRGLNPEMVIFFIASLYLFLSSFFYYTGTTIFLLSIAFTGIFIGLYSSSKPNGTFSIEFLNDHRKSFFSILLFVCIVIVSATLAFKFVGRFSSLFYFEKALSSENLPNAESNIKKAVSMYPNDLYLRTYSQIEVIKLNTLVSRASTLTEAEKADVQNTFDQAVGGAMLAASYNPKNYLNYQAVGAVYSVATSFGVADAYQKAVEAYNTASSLNPSNPSTNLALSRVALTSGKNKEAREYANAALALKPNYVDALLVLSQVARNGGNNKEALSYAEKALSILPTNEDLIKYVNSLKSGGSAVSVPEIDTEEETN